MTLFVGKDQRSSGRGGRDERDAASGIAPVLAGRRQAALRGPAEPLTGHSGCAFVP
jgi:hypothetical protein